MKIFFPLIILFLFSCSKSNVDQESKSNALNCTESIKAVVKKQNTNDSGSEYFYYLSIDGNIGGSSDVFPSELSGNVQVVGQKVDVKYSITEKMHKYVKCEPGHIMDPANPDERTMPIVNVCSAKPSTL